MYHCVRHDSFGQCAVQHPPMHSLKLTGGAPQDMVEVTVRFSRSLYAQTALQVFEPPRGFPMPPDMSPASATARLGMKLTCGFEMLYAQHARFKAPDQLHPKAEEGEYRSAGVVTTNPTTAGAFHEREQGRSAGSALNSNPAAQAYLASLQRRGYFQNSLPGSAKHTQLREAALCTFMTTEQYERSVAVLAAPAHRIDELLCEDPPQALLDQVRPFPCEGQSKANLSLGRASELFCLAASCAKPSGAKVACLLTGLRAATQMQGREDSDAWMSSGAEELDTQLAAREEEQAQGRKGTRHPAFNPDNMVARMKVCRQRTCRGPAVLTIKSLHCVLVCGLQALSATCCAGFHGGALEL